MKLYVLKYKNFYLRYVFNDEYLVEYLSKEIAINNATMYEDLEDAKNILKELKEENIKLFTKKDEVEKIKNKTYIIEIEINELGEINNG